MKIEYDPEVDALYIRVQQKNVQRTEEVEPGIYIDFDSEGRLVGVEILDATKRYSLTDIFNISTENLFLENLNLIRSRKAGMSKK